LKVAIFNVSNINGRLGKSFALAGLALERNAAS
jgi:hypothetical protein